MSASEFKARCLALLDEVGSGGEIVTILKRGRPVAQLVPPMYGDSGYPQSELSGSVTIHGDVLAPPVPADAWEAEDPPA